MGVYLQGNESREWFTKGLPESLFLKAPEDGAFVDTPVSEQQRTPFLNNTVLYREQTPEMSFSDALGSGVGGGIMVPDKRKRFFFFVSVNKETLISALRGGRHRHIFVRSRSSRRHSIVTVRAMEGKKEEDTFAGN